MKNRGYFIAFEGGEGSGKSTQVDILIGRLSEEGYAVTPTREPGGTRIGEQIRGITHNQENVDLDAKTEAYLMAASRAQHVEQLIEPALAAGRVVVCDRYVDSSIAYQGYGRKLGPESIEMLNELATNGARPDLTILLDVPLDVGMQRRHASNKATDRLDLQRRDFYERVRKGYLALAKKNAARYTVLDATGSVEDVATLIWDTVRKHLEKHNVKKT